MLVFMTPQVQIWMPAILALFGSLLVVVLTAWLTTKALSAQIEALRAETRQGFAELRPGLHTEISSVDSPSGATGRATRSGPPINPSPTSATPPAFPARYSPAIRAAES